MNRSRANLYGPYGRPTFLVSSTPKPSVSAALAAYQPLFSFSAPDLKPTSYQRTHASTPTTTRAFATSAPQATGLVPTFGRQSSKLNPASIERPEHGVDKCTTGGVQLGLVYVAATLQAARAR
jgi:hypothetical protein